MSFKTLIHHHSKTGKKMTYEITWTQIGEICITGTINGKSFSAAMMDLTDCGHGYVPHCLFNISELEAVAIIHKSLYISKEARYLKEMTSELEYKAQEEQKRIQEMENREEY